MPKRTPLSIPFELQRIKAQQIYEKRIALGKEGSQDGDWEQARIELEQNPREIRIWIIKQLFKTAIRKLWLSFRALLNRLSQIPVNSKSRN